MNIRLFIGDLLDALENKEVDLIIHQVNCLGIMGGGIAKQIKERFPDAFEVYQQTFKENKLKLGSLTISNSGVVNIAGQAGIGAGLQTDYSATVTAFCRLGMMIHATKNYEKLILGVPWKYGCGLGGGDWQVIRPLIEHYLEPHFFEIRYYDITGKFK